MTAAEMDAVHESFQETIHNLRYAIASESPGPVFHYPAKVAMSLAFAQILDLILRNNGDLPFCAGSLYSAPFTYAQIKCYVVAAPGVWCVGKVFKKQAA